MDEATRRPSAQERIEALGLRRHPEGGWFRETWRSPLLLPAEALPDHGGPRNAGTSILYLLTSGECSAPHRVRSDELWFFHAGDPLDLQIGSTPDDSGVVQRLGVGDGMALQALVPAGAWQSARPHEGAHGYALVGCVVVPGFDFDDFEMA